MGIREGLLLREYIDTREQKAEEAKLRAQLYGSQAKHYEAQNALLQLNLAKEQEFMRRLPQALMGSQATPVTSTSSGPSPGELDLPRPGLQAPGFSTQPYSAGPQAPGAMSTARLHDTQAFKDPAQALIDRISRLQLEVGKPDEFFKTQQALAGRQKMLVGLQHQELFGQIGLLEHSLSGLPQVDPSLPMTSEQERIASTRLAVTGMLAQLYARADKFPQLQALVRPRLLALQQGGAAVQPYTGAVETQIEPRPVTPAPGSPVVQPPIPQVQRRGTHQAPVAAPAIPQTRELTSEERDNLASDFMESFNVTREQADAMMDRFVPVREVPALPAGYKTVVPGKTQAQLAEERRGGTNKADQAQMNREIYGQPTPPAGKPQATRAMMAAAADAAKLQGQGLTPSTPTARTTPVPEQRAAAELRAQGLEPSQPGRSVPEQRAAIEFAYQKLGVEEQTKLVPLLQSTNIIADILRVPEAQAQTYIGLLRRPKKGVENLLADVVKAGAGDPERERFLANIKQLFYMLNRPDVGANFTSVEKEWIADAYPHGTELTYTAWKAKMDRLLPMLQDKLGILTGVMTTPRGQIPTKIQQFQGKPGAQTAPPGKKPETPEEIETRIREQMKLTPRTR